MQDFKHLTPKKFEYCLNGFQIEQKRKDEEMWRMGLYVQSAVLTAVEHNLAGRKAKSKYIEKPLLENAMQESRKITQDEIKKRREAFVEKMMLLKTNFEKNRGFSE